MREFNIVAKIRISSYKELSAEEKHLIDYAKRSTQNAYAPYSGFKVGAAVLLENGKIITGNNQENIAYPSGLCAERVAVFYANATYPDVRIKTIAVAAYFEGDYVEKLSPCGSCLQVLQEVENRYQSPVQVLLYRKHEVYIVDSVKDLMPLNFSF